MPSYKIQIYVAKQLVETLQLNELVIIGRRDPRTEDPAPIKLIRNNDLSRLIVADQHVRSIPRNWFSIVGHGDGQFEIRNLHSSHTVPCCHESPLAVGQSRTFGEELLIELGSEISLRVAGVNLAATNADEYRILKTIPPTPGKDTDGTIATTASDLGVPEEANIANLLRIALSVVQQSAGSDAFFQTAVAATTQIVNLDRTVLILDVKANDILPIPIAYPLADNWCVVASHTRDGSGSIDAERPVSSSLLSRVVESRATVIHDPLKALFDVSPDGGSGLEGRSLHNVECAVASPILNQNRHVIGFLYGDRAISTASAKRLGIADFEATLVEILAGSVAGGIARQAEERNRGRLSEFFSPKVANLLSTCPELMEGQDAEVSVLFCDIRGFSAMTQQLGPKKAIQWINDVMTELSQCVIDRDGVLVDYVGDELLAMWGAPGEQPDHAVRAIEAARAMLGAIETLRIRWGTDLPQRFGAGIGVNTGPARVGNVGSRQKFKYGPLGNTVNLGSRLQSATKQLGVDCIISRETAHAAACLGDCRRIAKLAVAGITGPVEVYQIVQQSSAQWSELAENYQLALVDFESQRFGEAARRLGSLVQQFRDDRPTRKLLSRAVAELDEPTPQFTGIWQLMTK